MQSFTEAKQSKRYMYFEEMLTRELLKLDNVETEGKDEIRQARKKCVKYIQSCLDQLELKALANESEMNMEVNSTDTAAATDNNVEMTPAEGPDQVKKGPDASQVKEMKLDSEVSC